MGCVSRKKLHMYCFSGICVISVMEVSEEEENPIFVCQRRYIFMYYFQHNFRRQLKRETIRDAAVFVTSAVSFQKNDFDTEQHSNLHILKCIKTMKSKKYSPLFPILLALSFILCGVFFVVVEDSAPVFLTFPADISLCAIVYRS